MGVSRGEGHTPAGHRCAPSPDDPATRYRRKAAQAQMSIRTATPTNAHSKPVTSFEEMLHIVA